MLGLLDFLDSAQECPEQPLATRQRVIAELEGMVGRNAVDLALNDLVCKGWIIKIERTAIQKNIVYWHDYALSPERINADLSGGNSDVPNSGPRGSRRRDRVRGCNRDVNKNEEVDLDINPPPPSGVDGGGGGVSKEFLDELVDAAAWGADNVVKPERYRAAVRRRILAEGATAEDMALRMRFLDYQTSMVARATKEIAKAAADRAARDAADESWKNGVAAAGLAAAKAALRGKNIPCRDSVQEREDP